MDGLEPWGTNGAVGRRVPDLGRIGGQAGGTPVLAEWAGKPKGPRSWPNGAAPGRGDSAVTEALRTWTKRGTADRTKRAGSRPRETPTDFHPQASRDSAATEALRTESRLRPAKHYGSSVAPRDSVRPSPGTHLGGPPPGTPSSQSPTGSRTQGTDPDPLSATLTGPVSGPRAGPHPLLSPHTTLPFDAAACGAQKSLSSASRRHLRILDFLEALPPVKPARTRKIEL